MTADKSFFDTSHLDIDLDLPFPADEMCLPDLYVGLEIDLLAPGDGIVTDRHHAPADRHHAPADRYEAADPMNQIEGQISPFTLSGWLRHGCEAVLHAGDTTACHPGEPDADYRRGDTYDRDLEADYHEKGACTDTHDDGCVIYDLFGGFGAQPGKLVRRPVSFSPIRRHVDVLDGEAEAHYRQVATHVRSRNDQDGGQPLRQADRDVLGNVEGTWKLTLRELKPEFVGLLAEAVQFLDAHSHEYAFQIGGARNFGAGIADVWLLNPLYADHEIRRVFNRAQDATQAMADKDDTWAADCRPAFRRALQARLRQRDSQATLATAGGDAA